MRHRFLVLGASGLVGGCVMRLLRQHGYTVAGASRQRTGDGWRRFDLLDPATHAAALEGMTGVLLLSRPGDEEAHIHVEPLVSAMQEAGVRRVVVLSALGAERRPDFSLRKVERLVEASGLEWVHVRPNFFMQMLTRPPLVTEINAHRSLSLPLGDAAIAYVDARDVAELAFTALTDPALTGRGIDVSGPEAFTQRAIAERIGRLLGEPVRFVDIPEDSARVSLLERGLPRPQAERVLQFYSLCRMGMCARPDVDGVVAGLLGRPLGTLDEFLAANRPAWNSTMS